MGDLLFELVEEDLWVAAKSGALPLFFTAGIELRSQLRPCYPVAC